MTTDEVKKPQPLSEEDRLLVAKIYDRIDRWSRDLQPYYDRVKTARKVIMLDDPGQDDPRENGNDQLEQPTLQLQTLKSTINNCVADQMDNMPEVMLAPERPGLEQTAMDLSDVVHFVLDRNRFEDVHYQRVMDYFVAGTSVLQVAWDETMDNGRGDIAVLRWPIEAMIWDPYVSDIQDARAVMKVSWHPMSWYEQHYPDVAEYIAPDEHVHNDIGVPDARAELDAVHEGMAMLVEYWYRKFDASTKRYKIHVAFVAGNALLDKAENVYRHGRYPFRFDAFTCIEGTPVGIGLVEELTPMMRYINRYARYIDENLRMSAKMRMLIRKEANIDIKALSDWRSNIITGDAIDPNSIQWLQSKPLNGMAVQQMLQFQTDIKQDSGQNQFTRGETAGGVTAAQAINALQEAGGKITRLRTTALNGGFKEIAEQIIWLVAQFYTDEKEQLITGSDGKAHTVVMSADHLMGLEPALPPAEELAQMPPELVAKVTARAKRKANDRKRKQIAPPYSVSVQVQRRNPLRIQAQNELYIQAYTMAAQANQQFPLTLLFDLLSVDGKDRIMPILEQVDQHNQQLAAALQQAEQLKGENEKLTGMVEQYGNALRQTNTPPPPLETEQVNAVAGTPEKRPF